MVTGLKPASLRQTGAVQERVAMEYERFVGKAYPSFTGEVDMARLRRFAEAVGESDQLYTDEEAARAAGYPSLPAPPTFSYCLAMDARQSFNILEDMGIPLKKAVHGAQRFTYRRAICAGDVITGTQKITAVYEKKGGALLFIDAVIDMVNQAGEEVCELHSTVVVRNG